MRLQDGLYARLSEIGFLKKSYTRKFLLVAFIGTHIPLIGLIALMAFSPATVTAWSAIVCALMLTLVATFLTLTALNNLLAPVNSASKALTNYYHHREIPQLPLHYSDEAGQLMRSITETLVELNALIEEKKDFAKMLSHDLRTPYVQLLGMVELIKMADDSEEALLYCNKIIEEGSKQLKFIGSVLTSMKSDDHEHTLVETERLCISEIAEMAIKSMEQVAIEKGVRIEKEIVEGATIEAQKQLLANALQNLLSNAVKFSHQGSKVKLRICRDDQSVLVQVSDKGIGFEPEEARNFFKKFSEGRQGTAGEAAMGFGLYSALATVQNHGGDITAYSTGSNEGATFSISLPIIRST
jgi:signal transduction histidine kinase